MEDIICTVPWSCGESDCPVGWHLSHYWIHNDGTYTECDSDGNHDPCDEEDVPGWDECEEAWLDYSRHVAQTGHDPLLEFRVPRTVKKKERYSAAFREGIAGPVLIKLTRRGKSVPVQDMPDHVAEYLMIKRTNNPNCNRFDGDWETLTACDGVKVYRGVARITFTVERECSRPAGVVERELMAAARKAVARKEVHGD